MESFHTRSCMWCHLTKGGLYRSVVVYFFFNALFSLSYVAGPFLVSGTHHWLTGLPQA